MRAQLSPCRASGLRRLQTLPAALLDQPTHIHERVLALAHMRQRPHDLVHEGEQPLPRPALLVGQPLPAAPSRGRGATDRGRQRDPDQKYQERCAVAAGEDGGVEPGRKRHVRVIGIALRFLRRTLRRRLFSPSLCGARRRTKRRRRRDVCEERGLTRPKMTQSVSRRGRKGLGGGARGLRRGPTDPLGARARGNVLGVDGLSRDVPRGLRRIAACRAASACQRCRGHDCGTQDR